MKKLLLAILVGLLAFPVAFANAGERLIWGRGSEFGNIDPHVVYDAGRISNRLNLYDGLYRWEDNPPKLFPWLAERYEVSDDGLKWTFKLRKGARFHDGSEVTAEAIQYSIERVLALGQGAAPLFSRVIEKGSTRVVDKYTVEFNLTKPYSPFLSMIPELHIVNPKMCKAHEKANDWGSAWLASHEAGSGSYRLSHYDPAIGFTMVRFKDHFLGWKGKYIEEAEFRTVHETASRVLALMKGEIHASDGYLPAEQVEKLERNPDVNVFKEPSMRTYLIRMNNQRPPLNDVHVRRAISYAFDYDGFISKVLKGRVTRNPGPIPFNLWGAPKDLKGYEYNLDKAREELAKASVKVDRPLEIHPLVGYAQTKEAALVLQSGLAQLGISLRIIEETWPTLVGKVKKMETTPDMWTHWISTYYPDPNNWIGESYNSAGWGTWKASCWYKNPKVDELLNRALERADLDERRKLYEKASHLLVEDAADIWIYNTDWYGPLRKNFHGLRFCPVGNGQECRWMYRD